MNLTSWQIQTGRGLICKMVTDAISWNLKWVKEGRWTYGEEWVKLTKMREMKDRVMMRLKNRSTRKNEQKRWEGVWSENVVPVLEISEVDSCW